MRFSRRGFLKGLGGMVGAAAVAPALALPERAAALYIPSQNLELGVPRQIVTATSLDGVMPAEEMLRGIDMILLRNEVMGRYGKLSAGTMLTVDTQTAERWIQHGVAVPSQTAPRDLQVRAAKRLSEFQDPEIQAWRHTRQQAREHLYSPQLGRIRSERSPRSWIDNLS